MRSRHNFSPSFATAHTLRSFAIVAMAFAVIHPSFPTVVVGNRSPPSLPMCNSTPTQRVYVHSPYSFHAVEEIVPSARKTLTPPSPPNVEWKQQETPSVSSDEKTNHTHMRVATNQLRERCGHFREMAFSSYGSSFLQAALREEPEHSYSLLWPELAPHLAAMLRDTHACYVVMALLNCHPAPAGVIDQLCQDEFLVCTLCTGTLHTRRIVQHFVDVAGTSRFLPLLMRSATSVCCTQQGCISAQRILDRCTQDEKELFFAIVRHNIGTFSSDAFGNYVVQYMLQHGNRQANSDAFGTAFASQLSSLSRDKYASNVVEKALPQMSPDAQSALVRELLLWCDSELLRILAHNVGNYTIQALIENAPLRDVDTIARRLMPLTAHVPYGRKVEAKLLRRLKGKVDPSLIYGLNQ